MAVLTSSPQTLAVYNGLIGNGFFQSSGGPGAEAWLGARPAPPDGNGATTDSNNWGTSGCSRASLAGGPESRRSPSGASGCRDSGVRGRSSMRGRSFSAAPLGDCVNCPSFSPKGNAHRMPSLRHAGRVACAPAGRKIRLRPAFPGRCPGLVCCAPSARAPRTLGAQHECAKLQIRRSPGVHLERRHQGPMVGGHAPIGHR